MIYNIYFLFFHKFNILFLIKLNDLDIYVYENEFRFYCKPYWLRLNLPGHILENSDDAFYDFDESKHGHILKNFLNTFFYFQICLFFTIIKMCLI